jgi:hypothetical protein
MANNWLLQFCNADTQPPEPPLENYFAVYNGNPPPPPATQPPIFQTRAMCWSQLTQPTPQGGDNSVYISSNLVADFSGWTNTIIRAAATTPTPPSLEIFIPTEQENPGTIVSTMSNIFSVAEETITNQLNDAGIDAGKLLTYLTSLNAPTPVAPTAVNLTSALVNGYYVEQMKLTTKYAFVSGNSYQTQIWGYNSENGNCGWSIGRGDPATFTTIGPDYIANGAYVTNGQLIYFWDRYLLQAPTDSTLWLQYPLLPTPDNVQKVQANLTSMQKFNDYVYNNVSAYPSGTVYNSLEAQTSDPGLAAGLQILIGALGAIGTVLGGPLAGFATTLLCSTLFSYNTSKPPTIAGVIAQLSNRLELTSQQLDTDLSTIIGNLAPINSQSTILAAWNSTFTFQGQTMQVSDLASGVFPMEYSESTQNPEFQAIAAAAIFAAKQNIWQVVLAERYQINCWQPTYNAVTNGNSQFFANYSESDMVSWYNSFLSQNPSYYCTWVPSSIPGPCNTEVPGMQVSEYNIGVAPSGASDGSISEAACGYLFIDGPNPNSSGMFTRETVFTVAWLPHYDYTPPGTPGAATSNQLSLGFLRAQREERSLDALLHKEGRAAVEDRVRKQAWDNPAFAHDLKIRPRQTLERFLGVKIPESASIYVTVEDDDLLEYGLVIPKKPS